MDRIAFLIDKTGERIDCLLNPEALEIVRHSGIRQRRSTGRLVTGCGLADDPLLHTGGGFTELKLDLLFDVSLLDISPGQAADAPPDVRSLTRPIWELTENTVSEEGFGEIQLVRLIWGKAWNIPGVIIAAAERFERFTPDGAPQRSWLRLRFRPVREPGKGTSPEIAPAPSGMALSADDIAPVSPIGDFPNPPAQVLSEAAARQGSLEEPLYLLAHKKGLPPSSWRALAALNGIENPLRVSTGAELRLPS